MTTDNWHRPYTQQELNVVCPSYLDKQRMKQDFTNLVAKNVTERFQPNLLNYRPASKEQIKEWSTWIYPEALTKVINTENKIKQEHSSEKFDPFIEEAKVANMFEPTRTNYMKTTRFQAYLLYGKEQHELFYIYNKSKLDDDLHNLYLHIRKHGKIIQHELPKQPIIPKKEED